mgnify:CR=1 FL=1
MKDKKLIYIAIIMICLTVILGISYAWFNTIIEGNENAKKHTVTTGDLRLTYTDTDTITIENAFPGDSYEKTVSVKNAGTVSTNYSLVWQELSNNIINNELVIEATCKRLNSSGTEEGTCEGLSQVAISALILKNNILIEPGYTHEYTLKVTFLDTGEVQDYNKKKTFNGKVGIEEYQLTAFREDDWSTIVANVKAGDTDKYKVGDVREINLGNYGIHTVRITNKSTPDECSTERFSQTACGFVLEFTNILSNRAMNTTNTNKGGWPASAMYTYLNTDLYNEFPADLKNSVIDTIAVSGHGYGDTDSFTSTDKLYLLAPKEIYSDWSDKYDSAKDLTRQLDYYNSKNVSTSNYSGALKKLGTTASNWWLRSAHSYNYGNFFSVNNSGYCNYYVNASYTYGVSPAFRIG